MMNERIRLLAEQAGLRFTQLLSNPMVPVVDGKETDLEKFAELIIRECVQTLLDNTPELFINEVAEEDWDKGYDQAMKDSVHHIKEHFGVEE